MTPDIHVIPVEDRTHEESRICWCGPYEMDEPFTDPDGNDRQLIIHVRQA